MNPRSTKTPIISLCLEIFSFLVTLLCLFVGVTNVQAQTNTVLNQVALYTSATPGTVVNLTNGSTAKFFRITWYPISAPASCSVQVDSSSDNFVTPVAAGVITSQNCQAASFTTTIAATVFNYIRVNVTAITGTNAGVVIVLQGFDGPPGSTSPSQIINVPSSLTAAAASMAKSTVLANSLIAKASAGNLFGLIVYSNKATSQFIQCFDSATVPADASVPILTFTVGGVNNGSWAASGTFPIAFTSGLTCTNSSTAATKTIGSADTWFNIIFI